MDIDMLRVKINSLLPQFQFVSWYLISNIATFTALK